MDRGVDDRAADQPAQGRALVEAVGRSVEPVVGVVDTRSVRRDSDAWAAQRPVEPRHFP